MIRLRLKTRKRIGLVVALIATIVVLAGIFYMLRTTTPVDQFIRNLSAKNVHELDIESPASTRDPLRQPFSSTSIWNTPIGYDAEYKYVDVARTLDGEAWAQLPYADPEHIVLRPDSPMTPLYYSDAAWTGKDRCQSTSQKIVTTMPIPDDFVVRSNGENSIISSLMPDNRTIRQAQPFARCSRGGEATALVAFSDVDIYGDGISGGHGGSNLSGIGGSLRVGELRKNGPPPRHALKLNLYAKRVFFNCSIKQDCYRWPASTMDGYAIGNYGSENSSPDRSLVMGSLLAIPREVNIDSEQFRTEPGAKLAWTLQNYGAYVVDDTYSPGVAFATEDGPDGNFVEQLESEFGIKFKQDKTDNTPWAEDMKHILRLLTVVDNNSPETPGGPGARMQPLAPDIQYRPN